MKTFISLVLSASLLSATAFGQNSKIAGLAKSSRAEAAQVTAAEKEKLESLILEIADLRADIQDLLGDRNVTETVRNVSVVISVTLAVTSGLMFAKAGGKWPFQYGVGLDGMAALVLGGLVTGGGAAIAGGTGAVSMVVYSFQSNKLEKLSAQLIELQDQLQRQLDAL